jgi:hypothetical protein
MLEVDGQQLRRWTSDDLMAHGLVKASFVPGQPTSIVGLVGAAHSKLAASAPQQILAVNRSRVGDLDAGLSSSFGLVEVAALFPRH